MSLSSHNRQTKSDSSERVLVTGASGFIGSRIVHRLMESGIPVAALVRDRVPNLNSLNAHQKASIQIVACDLHDKRAITDIVRSIKPTACIHAAWDVRDANYRHDHINQRWVQSSLQLFSALRCDGCRWMGVIGTCVEPRDGERAMCRYGAAKSTLRHRMFELASCAWERAMGICWWKLFQPYGPGEPDHRLIPAMIDALRRRERFDVHRPHDLRDFIHVDDVASAIVQSLSAKLSGVFELGTGIGHRIADVAAFVAEEFDASDCLHVLASAPRSGLTLIADSSELVATLAWKPQYELRSALIELIERTATDFRAVA